MRWLALALLLFGAGDPFPSISRTSWMEPAAFRLEIGMPRADVEAKIMEAGLKIVPGKYARQFVVHYSEKKTLTLGFVDDELQSLRFEYVDFIPGVRTANEERLLTLTESLGYDGKELNDGILLFDRGMPNVMVVLSTRHDDSFGRQGLGFLSVRYYDPSAEKLIP